MTRYLIPFLLLIMPPGGVSAQQLPEGIYAGRSFREFVEEMEAGQDIRFFFRNEWIDSVTVVQDTEKDSLPSILEKTLVPRGIGFTILDDRVYLFKERVIDPSMLLTFSFPDTAVFVAGPDVTLEETVDTTRSGPADRYRLIEIGRGATGNQDRATLNGFVRETETGEPVIGAVVFNEDQMTGVTTDAGGYYVISLEKGRHRLTFRSMGKKEEYRHVLLRGNGTLNVDLEEKITQLKGVVITADRYQNVAGIQVGLNKIDVGTIRQIPAAMGETDVLKMALLLPGVQTVGEGASGFNVRGGSTDQNLIILNGAPVFNTSHLFGFFSAFNPDVIKEFKLFKSGITAEYGGRISSVFDISTRNGNRKNFAGQGGISPITGRLVLEGPLAKDRASFLLGGRSTYSDWILKRINDPSIRNSSASFRDLNGKVSYDINANNQAEISAYYSNDLFRLNSDTAYRYTNTSISAGWKHIFSTRLSAGFSAIFSRYDYNITSDRDEIQAFSLKYGITHSEVRADFTHFPAPQHRLKYGAGVISYRLQPGSFTPLGERSLVAPENLERENALETALYAGDEYSITPQLTLYAGIRYSFYAFLGPRQVVNYYPHVPVGPTSISDTSYYGPGALVQTYSGPEWRMNLRYRLSGSSSFKVTYNRLRQYLNMLSNTAAVSPTDTWKLSDRYIKPQVGDQVAIGFYQDFRSQSVETSVELYYKRIRDILEYKGGALLLMNEVIEQDLVSGLGRAYGAEFMVKRTAGKLNGWVSYTYSRTLIRADSEFPLERINGGEWFPANHDKPHDVTFVGNYKFSRRFSISSNVTYSTGRPITYPVARYTVRNMTLMHYTLRNEYRIPDYFRWDLSANIEGNLRSRKLAHSSWSLSVYNVTGRDNVYSIYFVSTGKDIQGYKLSIFTRPFFTVTYHFRF